MAEFVSCACEDKNIGDYFELIAKRDELEKECFEKIDEIVEIKFVQKEDEELQCSLQIEKKYENYIKDLNENLRLLKAISEDLKTEFDSRRELLNDSEKALNLQKKALEMVTSEKSEKEKKLLEEVEKIKSKFIKKREQLDDFKSEYSRIANLIELSRDEENSIQLEIAKINFDLYRILCQIKSHNETIANKKTDCPIITEELCDKLQEENERISHNVENEENSISKIRKDVHDIQNQIDLIRSNALNEVKVINLHNEWKDGQFTVQRIELENAIKECKRSMCEKDPELEKLNTSLELMKIDCLEAEKTLENLQSSMSELESKPTSCYQSTFDPHPNYKIPSKKVFLGTDHIGSKFIKVEE